MVESVIGLAGVILGAAISFVLGWVVETKRWKRESAAQRDAVLIEAITTYAAALKMQSRVALRVSAAYWPQMTTNVLQPETGATMIGESEDQRSIAFERLLLLAPASVHTVARRWQESVWALHPIANAPLVFERPEFEELLLTAAAARDEFYRECRRALAIPDFLAPAPARASSEDPTWQSKP